MESLTTQKKLMLGAFLLLLPAVMYLVYQVTTKKGELISLTDTATPTATEAERQVEQALFLPKETFNSDVETMNDFVNRMDVALSNPNISTDDRIRLLLESGYTTATVRTVSDIDNAIVKSSSYFSEALDLIEQHPELKEQYAATAKFGYLYNFVTNCFTRPVVKNLPSKYLTTGLPAYDSNSVSVIREHQIAAFRSMIAYAYTDADLANSNDKSIISHRAFAASVFLASFADLLSEDEKIDLIGKIRSDREKYPFASFSIFVKNDVPSEIRGVLLSELYMTLAYDIENSFEKKALSKEDNANIDARWTAFRAQLRASKSADKISLHALGRIGDGYHISSLERRYGDSGAGHELLADAIESFKINTFASPESTDVTRGSYNYTLSPSGMWASEKSRLFEVALTHKELYDTLVSAGITIETYSKL